MRKPSIISTIMIAVAAMIVTACENLFNDAIEKYAADTVYLFGTVNAYNGNLGGRDGADDKCRAVYDAHYSYLNVKNIRAFINVTENDEIRDMPENFGVPEDARIVSPNGTVIDDDWDALLDGTVRTSMQAAGVVAYNYWTGEGGTASGTYNPNNCHGWTTDTGALGGVFGDYTVSAASQWLNSAMFTCDQSLNILCIAW